MSARAFWASQDKATERRALVERHARTGEYVELTHEEWIGWMKANGYIVGVSSRGEGMGEE